MKLFATVAALGLILQARPAPPALTLQQQLDNFGEPLAVLNAEKAWLGADAFWPLAKAGDPLTRRYALRAIGRLEDPANVPALLEIGRPRDMMIVSAVADAIAQSLYGFDPDKDPDLIAAVSTWFLAIADLNQPESVPIVPLPLGQIRYGTLDQFHAAERRLIKIQEKYESAGPRTRGFAWYKESQIAIESLFRFNPRLGPPDDVTISRLKNSVRRIHQGDDSSVAFRALAGRGLDAETMLVALQGGGLLAAQVLAGNGGGLNDEQRLAAILEALKAANPQVRYEAFRAYIRRGVKTLGCQPLVDAINDPDSHVALQAIDALGEACKDDDDITKRLEGEVRVPPAIGPWHRETHAFVAAAKRSPERVTLFMNAFTTHVSFWVRMYSVHAVVAAGDIPQLEKLAYDSDDNVREGALAPLLTLKKAPGDPVLVADLERNDVQLLRSAAILSKAAPADETLRSALVNAVVRLTREGKETSRDGRLALIDALQVHGRSTDVEALKPLLDDFDPRVADAAAALLTKLSGSVVKASPMPVRRGWAQQFTDLSRQCVSVALSNGRGFRMRMAPSGAPIAVDRFLKLALVDRYYDGLSIHRVVPNFVIQAGSPGANEYSGHKEYMRDEIGLPNVAGSVGLSIRGRNTGDAQFYVNLVDNARLDRGYTIFAKVYPEDMDVIQGIEEGVIMNKITPATCPGPVRALR